MKRTVNPTGKSRITHDNVSAHFDEDADSGVLEVTWDLEGFDFDQEAELIFETYSLEVKKRGDIIKRVPNKLKPILPSNPHEKLSACA